MQSKTRPDEMTAESRIRGNVIICHNWYFC
jgi:hypothetical protein